MKHFFDGKLKWAALLAQKQQIVFSISDLSSSLFDLPTSPLDGLLLDEQPPPPLPDSTLSKLIHKGVVIILL